MDIYKLNDDIIKQKKNCKTRDCSDDGDCFREELKITGLKQGVKNENRVNVYVNNKYAFSLDISQVVEMKVKVGRVINAEELDNFKKAAEFGKLYQRTLEWALMRPRSVRETKDYLYRKLKPSSKERSEEDNSNFSQTIIKRLLEHGYLDDLKFAEWYVENRFVKKGVSQKRLKMELRKKGISAEIIDEVLDGRDEEEELRKMIVRKRAKLDDEKLIAYLCRQGFSYELVKKVLNED